LNYELETYLEALSEFPKDDRLTLETVSGSARLQKTDILKRTLWFSYPNNNDWIAIDIERVNKIIALNKKGKKPDTLVDQPLGAEIINKFEPAPDLISDQDISRYDELDKQRKKQGKKRRNKRKGKPSNKSKNPQGTRQKKGPEGAQKEKGQGNKGNKNRDRNRNKKKPNNKPSGQN